MYRKIQFIHQIYHTITIKCFSSSDSTLIKSVAKQKPKNPFLLFSLLNDKFGGEKKLFIYVDFIRNCFRDIQSPTPKTDV